MLRLIILSFTILALLGLAIGCDDDTNPTTSSPDPADSAFLSEFFLEEVLSTDFESLDMSWQLLETIVPGVNSRNIMRRQSTSDGDDIIINAVTSYSYENGWHIFEFEAVAYDYENSDTIDISGSDSVQILSQGVAQQNPDEQVEIDGMRARAHVDFAARQTDNNGEMHHRLDADLAVVGTDSLLTLNGTLNDALHGTEISDTETCVIDITLDQTITGMVTNLQAAEGDCPEAGTISVTAGLDVNCQSATDTLSISGTWVVTAVANDNNTITVTFTSGLISFTVTESCDNSAARQPIWNRMNF